MTLYYIPGVQARYKRTDVQEAVGSNDGGDAEGEKIKIFSLVFWKRMKQV